MFRDDSDREGDDFCHLWSPSHMPVVWGEVRGQHLRISYN